MVVVVACVCLLIIRVPYQHRVKPAHQVPAILSNQKKKKKKERNKEKKNFLLFPAPKANTEM